MLITQYRAMLEPSNFEGKLLNQLFLNRKLFQIKVLILPDVNATSAIKNNAWTKHFWTKAIKLIILNTKLIQIKTVANMQASVATKTKLCR